MVISEGLNGQVGGVQRVSRQILEATMAHGVPAVIWSSNDETCHHLPPFLVMRGFERKYTRMFLSACFGRLPENVSSVSCWHLHLVPVAALLAMRLQVPLAIFLHGMEAWENLSFMERWGLSQARKIGANSHHTLKRFHQRHPAFQNRTSEILPLAISNEFLRLTETMPLPLRKNPYILTVCRQDEDYKGVDTLLKAFQRIHSTRPGLHLVCVGTGPALKKNLAMTAELGLENAVTFTGHVTDEELVKFYAQSELFVLLSEGEGFGIVFLEAMFHSKPVIATRVDASSEVVVDGKTGVLVPSRDSVAAAKAMENLLDNPELRRRYGEAGRARVQADFMPRHFQDRLKAFFDDF